MSNELPSGNIHVRFDQTTDEYKADDGTVLLTVNKTIPIVTTQSEAVSNAINEYVKNYNVMGVSTDEALKWAQSDYKNRGKANWDQGYMMEIVYSLERNDPAVLSFIINAESNMGGTHPSEYRAALNFDSQTGKRLRLADVITTEEKAAVKAIQAAILEQTRQEKYKDMLFKGYEESIDDLLTEDSWYLGKEGLHIIGNEYIISPYAAGILDFFIPYNRADFIKEEYML